MFHAAGLSPGGKDFLLLHLMRLKHVSHFLVKMVVLNFPRKMGLEYHTVHDIFFLTRQNDQQSSQLVLGQCNHLFLHI